jgi:hypothetical protein
MSKLEDSTSTESERGLWSYSIALISFASRNRGKSLHSIKCSIPLTPTLHLHHTTTSLIISRRHHLRHNITLSTTTHHHLRHKINSSNNHPSLHLDTTDPKSLLTNHLQLAPWPSHYRATPLPQYHGNTDPYKFLMCYEAAKALAGGDEATLTKSVIISLEDPTANWYSRL